MFTSARFELKKSSMRTSTLSDSSSQLHVFSALLNPGQSLMNVTLQLMTKERYFDDLKVGDQFKSEPLEVTERQVVEFAHKFDPQMFHLTRKSAERTVFKGLIASGWHTAAMTMRLFVQTLNFTEGAIGLGVDELRWPDAVRPDDKLKVETEIIDLRVSRSKLSHGVVRLRNVTVNQHGEVVQTMSASALVLRRGNGI